jgi:CBS domain
MEQTYFVPETMPLWNVLEEMRKRRLHMAIVVDEYGGTAGIVTLEVCAYSMYYSKCCHMMCVAYHSFESQHCQYCYCH